MHIDRAHADRVLPFLGFALSFLFVLAVVASGRLARSRKCRFSSSVNLRRRTTGRSAFSFKNAAGDTLVPSLVL